MTILDTTIRDGSYAVDFKFTCGDVKNAVSKLVKLGIEYIEIGHGQGLNASSPEHGISLCSDTEYLDAAMEVAGEAKIGMFCIPGIARPEDIVSAHTHGLSFVRIGISADNVEKALPYIEAAKNVGVVPMVNFMKTYIYSPDVFAKKAHVAWQYGAEVIYMVDSAGCMLPSEISEYVTAIRNISKEIKIGFHGHNNLGMAVANSLHCVELGIDYIDCTFQGLGRSIGNTSTEMFVMALKKKHGDKVCDIDVPRLLEYGYVLLKDISPRRDIQNPLDLVCGYAGFHSGFQKYIFKCCEEKKVDPLRLIIAYSSENQESLDYKRLCEIAETLPRDDFEGHPYSFRQYFTSMYNDK